MKKLLSIILTLSLFVSLITTNVYALTSNIGVTYQGYIQSKGWLSWVSNEAILGTPGQTLKLEALRINLTNLPSGAKIKYETHLESLGWQAPVYNGAISGKPTSGLRIEAMKISLENLSDYSVHYQTYVQNLGWQGWVSDGQVSGTIGKSLKVEAVRIKVVQKIHPTSITLNKNATTVTVGLQELLVATIDPSTSTNKSIKWTSSDKGIVTVDSTGKITGINPGTATITATTVDGGKSASCIVNVNGKADAEASVTYKGYVNSIGWQDTVSNSSIAGTTGQSLRLEALKINLVNVPKGAKIKYQVHVNNLGWLPPVYDGNLAGVIGKGLQIEAIKITLENMPGYSVEYKAQSQNVGWQSWMKNGEISGTVGRSLRLEAIKIRIVKNVYVQYQAHVEGIGWKSPVTSGTITGTDGQFLRVEALNIKLINAPKGATIKYQAHVENIGWQGWKSEGEISGTVGQSLKVEALKIQLVNAPGYSIQYQADIENLGWQTWVQDGQVAGTSGFNLRIKGLRIKVIPNTENLKTPAITPPPFSLFTSTKYKLVSYLNPTPNRVSVGRRAIELHGGITINNCVYFSSEAHRRIGFNVPLWMSNTKNYVPYLSSLGYKKVYNRDLLTPGSVCFTINDYGGNPTHTFVFMDWVNPDDHTLAYVVDNQAGNTIHIRSMLQSGESDAFAFFMTK